MEVALGTLGAFEGNIIMERKPDGSVGSFQSSRNRPRWQYATFIAALCHDLGKLFDLELKAEGSRYPLSTELTELPSHQRFDPELNFQTAHPLS